MANNTMSGRLFKKMITNGAVNLKNNHKEIDSLNVFPVPDGDTGTNMQMTMMAGIKEINAKFKTDSLTDVSHILSRGLLMGARGNSGVILSQFFRGLSAEISKIKDGAASVDEFIDALVGGYQMSYRAVMDPVEGTILTVVRESAEKVNKERKNLHSIEDVMNTYLSQARETLAKTPEILPVLKESGVVDSGGAGFVKIIEGMQMALEGRILEDTDSKPQTVNQQYIENNAFLIEQDIKFMYCTEFILKLNEPDKFDEKEIKNLLSKLGDSMVVAVLDDILKVHVHTNQCGVALTLAQKYGELQTIKIENMKLQHTNIIAREQETPKKPKKYAIIAVATGEGLVQTFKEIGVDYVIEGGQTMNPSTEDFVKAVESINAENYLIIPNNSNIILTAEQTINLLPEKTIRVLPTKNISQGYAALMVFDTLHSIDENLEDMSDVLEVINSGEVTYAVRDTIVKGKPIKKGEFIGITGGEIETVDKNQLKSTQKLLDKIVDDEAEIVTVFYGKDVKESETKKLENYILNKFDHLDDCQIIYGGQEVYSYIIVVE